MRGSAYTGRCVCQIDQWELGKAHWGRSCTETSTTQGGEDRRGERCETAGEGDPAKGLRMKIEYYRSPDFTLCLGDGCLGHGCHEMMLTSLCVLVWLWVRGRRGLTSQRGISVEILAQRRHLWGILPFESSPVVAVQPCDHLHLKSLAVAPSHLQSFRVARSHL